MNETMRNYIKRRDRRLSKTNRAVRAPLQLAVSLDVMRGAALAGDTHQELTEAVVQPLDVSEHPHPQMVRKGEPVRPCSTG
jgi:hypothetical protein